MIGVGAGAAQAAVTASGAAEIAARTILRAISALACANRRTDRRFIPEPREFQFGLESSPLFNVRWRRFHADRLFYRFTR
jgi:hypothetical protein